MYFVTKVWIFLRWRPDLRIKNDGMKTITKFRLICTMVGKMRPFVRQTGGMSALLEEMKDDTARLDNLLYETLGLSGEDVVKALQNGRNSCDVK